jgi:AbrB family looped-hinge helix DNA binding protein
MTEKTSIQRRFTLTIPKPIREKIHLEEGMDIFWDVKEGKIILTPRSFQTFHERFKGRPKYETKKDKEEVEKAFLKEYGTQ